MGATPRLTGMLCHAGTFAIGSAAASAPRRAGHVHRSRWDHPARARSALFTYPARRALVAVPAGRSHARPAARDGIRRARRRRTRRRRRGGSKQLALTNEGMTDVVGF